VTKITIEDPVLVLVGPTAIGKTALSLQLAQQYNCEIISVDSMQVYRYMDIGTAKATLEEREEVKHYLIDVVDPDENFDASVFANMSLAHIKEIHSRGKIPLLTGGTGLYLKALLEGIFPDVPSDDMVRKELKKRLEDEGSSKLHEELSLIDYKSAVKIHPNDSHRVLRALEIYRLTGRKWSDLLTEHFAEKDVSFSKLLQIGLTCERDLLYERINSRCEIMLQSGLEEEVRNLSGAGYSPELKSMKSIGYRHMCEYLDGLYGTEDLKRLLARDTRRYAKRQYTWFSGMKDLEWMEVSEPDVVVARVGGWL